MPNCSLRLNTGQFEYFLTNGTTGILRIHTHVMYDNSCDRSEVNNPQKETAAEKKLVKRYKYIGIAHAINS